jgi:predicted MFS family arabinose efflux permease
VILTVLILMAAALFSLSLTAALVSPLRALPVVLAVAAVWGLTAWAFAPAQQARLVSVTGLRNAPLILSLNSSFQYVGFSLGAGLGSITVAFGGVLELGWVGGTCVLAGLLMFLVAGRRVVKS